MVSQFKDTEHGSWKWLQHGSLEQALPRNRLRLTPKNGGGGSPRKKGSREETENGEGGGEERRDDKTEQVPEKGPESLENS